MLTPKTRNAPVTRQTILDCARTFFRTEGYDAASLRDIAGCAGIDPAMVLRYFGSKEELLVEVLQTGSSPSELYDGGREGFGRRVADLLVYAPPNDSKLDCLLIILRSMSSQPAAEVIRKTSRSGFYDPLVEWLGGAHADARAALLAAVMKGVTVSRFIEDDFGLDVDARAALRDRLAEVLQSIVEAG